MKVLYCSHTADLKGSAISLHQLMAGLDKKEFSPVAAFSKPGPMLKALEPEGIPGYVLKRRGFLGIGLVREAAGLIDREGIELVHLNSAVPFCKYIGIAAKLRGLPVIWHIREDPEGKRLRRHRMWINLLSDRILVVSSDLLKIFENTGKAVKIANGVDTESFRPDVDGRAFRNSFGIPEDAFVFGLVGTIEERKGVQLFLKSAEELIAGGLDAFFAVVGDGQPEAVRSLRGFLAERPGLSRRFVLTGRLENMPGVMAGIDVLVLPSLWEGFPRTLIEANAAGRPAVATAVGEVSNILKDGETGFLIPPGDQAALTVAMKKCLETRVHMAEMGTRGRERALREFTISRHVEAVTEQYRALLAGRK